MNAIHSFNDHDAIPAGFGVRVLLCCADGANGAVARRLASLGARVEVIDELFTALSEVIDDPIGYGMLVLNCDNTIPDGLEGGRRAVKMMAQVQGRIPVILVSKDCVVQSFPEDRMAPTELRAPLSLLSLRVGFEHALQERLAYLAA